MQEQIREYSYERFSNDIHYVVIVIVVQVGTFWQKSGILSFKKQLSKMSYFKSTWTNYFYIVYSRGTDIRFFHANHQRE